MGLTKKFRVVVVAGALAMIGALGLGLAPSASAATPPDPGKGICVGGFKITFGSATLLNLENTWICEPWV